MIVGKLRTAFLFSIMVRHLICSLYLSSLPLAVAILVAYFLFLCLDRFNEGLRHCRVTVFLVVATKLGW